jgi:hypothetical protein
MSPSRAKRSEAFLRSAACCDRDRVLEGLNLSGWIRALVLRYALLISSRDAAGPFLTPTKSTMH